MLVALSDTHRQDGLGLTDHLQAQIAAAETVVHCGDFTTLDVLETLRGVDASVTGVFGNSDSPAVREQLPETTLVEYRDYKLLLAHGHRHTETALTMLARQESADIVLVGHTHRAGIQETGEVPIINPGSHADPRGPDATYAAFEPVDGGLRSDLRTIDGGLVESVEL